MHSTSSQDIENSSQKSKPTVISEMSEKTESHLKQTLDPTVTNITNNSSQNSDYIPGPGPKISESSLTSTTATTSIPKNNDTDNEESNTAATQANSNGNKSEITESVAPSPPVRRHTGGDCRWEAIQNVAARETALGLGHFRLLKRLGYGDIGSVYLVELLGTGTYFAMKVMDRASLVSRNKLMRAQTEREILGLLDHPFLPTLYTHFETDKFYCLVMEYCSGGNLHSLRQKQQNKHFTEQAARFFAAEVLLALEYLHLLGVVYRDLKPENVLVREEGHIMLSDFDLSLRCTVNPTLVKSSSVGNNGGSTNGMTANDQSAQGSTQTSTFFPRILPKRNRKTKSDFGLSNNPMEFMAEPTEARSMSFVGTHEYLAPEIIRGDGHGSAVDWWTFGIFLYELLHGTTPFKGSGNRATLCNVVGQPLRFPETPPVSSAAKDLIRGLLVKEPQKRIAYHRGATEIKQHPFFDGVNWALVRSMSPPYVPDPVDYGQFASKDKKSVESSTTVSSDSKSKSTQSDSHLDFEYF